MTNAHSPYPPRHRSGHHYAARVSTHEKSEWLRERTRKNSHAWLTRILFFLAALVGGRGLEAAPVLDAVRQIAPQAAELDWSDTTPGSTVLYNVERATSHGGPWQRLIPEPDRNDTRRFTDADLPASTGTFYYRIGAVYEGEPSEQFSAPTPLDLDPACTGFCLHRGMDRDADGTLDTEDNCVALANDQSDSDGDGIGDACDVPADYSTFLWVEPGNTDDLRLKLNATPDTPTHLYLGMGSYYIDETIEIRRTAPLILHGPGRSQTQLIAMPGTTPVFRISDAASDPQGTHIQFSNFRFRNHDETTPETGLIAISLETTQSGHLDITEMSFSQIGSEIRGPGFVRVQHGTLSAKSALEQALLVDHPDADVFMIGGGLGGGGGPPEPGVCTGDPGTSCTADSVCEALGAGACEGHVDRTQISLLRQKQGRVRAYTAANGGTRGIADYWIESGSKFGPHMLGDIRTEGTIANGYDCTVPGDSENLTSRLLYVPPTDERVDVFVKGTLAGWDSKRRSCPHTAGLWDLASYSSPGRLWMLQNRGGWEYLVTGTAPGAHVVSANNLSLEPVHSTVDLGGTGRLVSVGDLERWNWYCWEQELGQDPEAFGQAPCDTGPRHRFYLPDGSGGYLANDDPAYDPSDPAATPPDRFETLAAAGVGVLPFPRDDIPPPLGRPKLLAPLPGMIDVTAAPYGATGDGSTDDTAALQAALSQAGSGWGTTNSAVVYFPAGTYCVTSTLYWNHTRLTTPGTEPYLWTSNNQDPSTVLSGGSGGWWAGAGADVTTIRYDTDCDGNPDVGDLFASQKMPYQTVQGLTFETAPHSAGDDNKTFWVENYRQQCSVTNPSLPDCNDDPPSNWTAWDNYGLPDPFSLGATTGSVFDDMVFRGGAHAYAMSLETSGNNSEVLWMHSRFTDADRGITLSNTNSLNNIVYDVSFLRNAKVMGGGVGGDFSVFGAKVDSGICPTHLATNLYVYGLDDTSEGCTSYLEAEEVSYNVSVSMLFENSRLAPRGAGPHVSRNRNGSMVFLHSEVTRPMVFDLGGDAFTMESLTSLHSTHPDWVLDRALDATNFESTLPIAGPPPVDSDGDGVSDDQDAFPSDPGETTDTDEDGQGDNADLDDDGDGVLDDLEDAGPNGGDANDDSYADALQASVVSLPGLSGADYVTLEVSEGCQQVSSATLQPESALPSEDTAYAFPLGVLGFTLPCTRAYVKLYFHTEFSLAAPYRKFGPGTPGDPTTNTWYEFPGAVFGSQSIDDVDTPTVNFTLYDGQLGDATGLDGQIVDPGGPTLPADSDGDGIPYEVDNCLEVANPLQIDTNQDGYGNACDPDLNNDGTTGGTDFSLFLLAYNSAPGSPGFSLDADFTGDGLVDDADFAVYISYSGHPLDLTAVANQDDDGWTDPRDNCPLVGNADQANADGDALGDVCDPFPGNVGQSGDGDGDGSSDSAEDAGPNGGDANADGIADSLQAGVVSLPDLGGSDYISLEVSEGCLHLNAVTVQAENELGSQDPSYDYPLGLVGFTLPCASGEVTMHFFGAAAEEVSSYRKFGPLTPGDSNSTAWYALPGATWTEWLIGAEPVVRVSFSLTDGELGDATGVDGQIVDPGGPALASSPAVGLPVLSPHGLVLLAATLLAAGIRRHRSGD